MMANEQHLMQYKDNFDRWDEWRKQNPEIKPDLRDGSFSDMDLKFSDLSHADLRGASFMKCDLAQSDFECANLEGANLWDSTLQYTSFVGANLRHVNLREANLTDTNLDNADLTGATLWESRRSSWSIKNVACEYVYWDKSSDQKTYYDAGEFERLHSDGERIELIYPDGISAIEITTLPMLIHQLHKIAPQASMRLSSIEECPGRGSKVTISIHASESVDVLQLGTASKVFQEMQLKLRENEKVQSELESELNILYRKILPNLMTGSTSEINIGQLTGGNLIVNSADFTVSDTISIEELTGLIQALDKQLPKSTLSQELRKELLKVVKEIAIGEATHLTKVAWEALKQATPSLMQDVVEIANKLLKLGYKA